MRIGVAAVVLGLLVAGCGGNNASTSGQETQRTTTVTKTVTGGGETTSTAAAEPIDLELYFLADDGRLVAASRRIEHTPAPGTASLHQLLVPPTGMKTQVPAGLKLAITDGAAQVTGGTLNEAALAQLVYTLTSFPTVKTVNGKTRADVEAFVPAILVESPTAGESVKSPLHVTGNANTFEATFNYSLKDASGKELAHDVVTATSGSGERGTFEFTAPFKVDGEQSGTLSVFELSAENGSVVHERDIPLELLP